MSNTLPLPIYITKYGKAYLGDSLELLKNLHENSVDLVITSPPFALLRPKHYGNEEQTDYVDWLLKFASEIKRVLKDTGSFVIDLGGAYEKGKPIRSLYNYRVLIRLCDEFEFKLAEEFFWFNPSKLPSPIEWVNKRKIRVKDSVNTVWWLSKTEFPKADVKKVKVPYSKRMKKLLENPETFYTPKERPSGHDISNKFGKDNGGAIPSNLLTISNTESNSKYLRLCKQIEVDRHPARFPQQLPSFFIQFLTEPGDLVLDIFAGSNTTGQAAEDLSRKWIAFEKEKQYIATSAFRFLAEDSFKQAHKIYTTLLEKEPLALVIPQEKLLFDCIN
ncbi:MULTISPECIES: DNA-methyltransferase [unclassified Coleofasciculus]|uniref:DNA-methyltransferase n=1 Tax=unclassified Coleofasciculus TaxID=2692782 RepID=UPI001882948A|nr:MULTISPECIES: site-specific DNA-methyltransferase [unclassified Coleofasciculus]MBE9129990.1 site-specific DNA-methyltransferase [Coleofasciculus sp. LEGE 07081]MBE9151673.1 site-specific DNA-methyltransferase [Coleofasciculus sp. LEGE 07092]